MSLKGRDRDRMLLEIADELDAARNEKKGDALPEVISYFARIAAAAEVAAVKIRVLVGGRR